MNIIKRLRRLRKKVMADSTAVAVSTIVGRAPLIGNLLNFAKENRIELIVMGTQGCSGLQRTIIGSVAARVAERSDIPVLLVPEKYELKHPVNLFLLQIFPAPIRLPLQMLAKWQNSIMRKLPYFIFKTLIIRRLTSKRFSKKYL